MSITKHLDYHLTAQQNFEEGRLKIPLLEDKAPGYEYAKAIWLPHAQVRSEGIEGMLSLPTFLVHDKEYVELQDRRLDLTAAEYDLWANSRLKARGAMYRHPRMIGRTTMRTLTPNRIDEILQYCMTNGLDTNAGIWRMPPEHSLRSMWLGITMGRIVDMKALPPVIEKTDPFYDNSAGIFSMIAELYFGATDMESVFAFYAELMNWALGRKVDETLTVQHIKDFVRIGWDTEQFMDGPKTPVEQIWHFPYK